MRQVYRVLFVFLALIFLSVGLRPGFALTSHINSCYECTQPDNRSLCTAYAKLQETFRQLSGTVVLTSCFLATPILLQIPLNHFLNNRHTISLVGLNVKLNC